MERRIALDEFGRFTVTLLMSNAAEMMTDEELAMERRRGLRVRQTRPVKIYDSTTARYFGGQTEDISTTGLRLELPAYAPISEGETLNIHVGLNQRGESLANRRQMLPARVVWVHREISREGAKLEIGVEFFASIAAKLDAA